MKENRTESSLLEINAKMRELARARCYLRYPGEKAAGRRSKESTAEQQE